MIKGLDETIKALQNMGKLNKKPIKDLLRKQGSKIIADARANCSSETVKRSIKFITKNEGRFPTTVLIGVDSKSPGTDTITVAPLATMIEYGSAPRYTKDGNYRGAIQARPFMRPAFDTNKSQITDTIKKDLVKIIETQAKNNNLK
jgi:HK97 gp10 family phage protein